MLKSWINSKIINSMKPSRSMIRGWIISRNIDNKIQMRNSSLIRSIKMSRFSMSRNRCWKRFSPKKTRIYFQTKLRIKIRWVLNNSRRDISTTPNFSRSRSLTNFYCMNNIWLLFQERNSKFQKNSLSKSWKWRLINNRRRSRI